mmetsp:Transcript_6897/g.12747  ORF Transcript_6897/g.12747 Transcript_6897/m.12747 type:complete len:783 (+) Transcript_6897:305-2653(+)
MTLSTRLTVPALPVPTVACGPVWDTAAAGTLKVLVQKYLGLGMLRNATFLAEQLLAIEPSKESVSLLATCFMRDKQFNRAYTVLQRDFDPSLMNDKQVEDQLDVDNRYLLAQCCYELGKLREAEAVLVQDTPLEMSGPQKCVEDILEHIYVPNGAAGLYLLGLICTRDNRREHAVTYFCLALRTDPFLWDAFEQLCELGVDIDPSAFFGVAPEQAGITFERDGTVAIQSDKMVQEDETHVSVLPPNPQIQRDGIGSTIPVSVPVPLLSNESAPDYCLVQGFNAGSSSASCRTPLGSVESGMIPISLCLTQWPHFDWSNPARLHRESGDVLSLTAEDRARVQGDEMDSVGEGNQNSARRNPSRGARWDASRIKGQQMESAALGAENQVNQMENNPNSKQNSNENSSGVDATKPGEGNARAKYAGDGMTTSPWEKRRPGLDAVGGALCVLDALRGFGEALLLVSQFCCSESIAALDALPPRHQNTGWAAHQKGRAFFEMGDYRGAKVAFEHMREVAPDRTAGLEIYSTSLWHLKAEVELCYLAQHALSIDKLAPESWICIGNCFSLQKEHDVATKFFQRALQIDPRFTYAYTLSAHEFVSNEDFEKAIACYRHAIRTDPRHYNAWYGLGTIYHRQEKFELAECHFRRAISINPRSSVLYCYLGMVLHAGQHCEEALNMLQRASELEPANPQARFQRALVLRTMECYDAALEELEAVRDFAPRESSVHFLMGKVCKQLGRKEEAMMHFTTALDLDPKDSNLIKLAIDKLDSPSNEEGDGMYSVAG